MTSVGWGAVANVAIAAFFTLAGCGRARSKPGSAACIADSLGTLHVTKSVPTCADTDLLCRLRCTSGDSDFCLALAYETEKDPQRREETVRLYRRACLLGDANACTNYAADIWARTHADNALTCARRTFQKACEAKEPFACGMVGRLMLENTKSPRFPEGRKYLETACNDVGGFPCRVLAKHLESGKLGRYDPGTIPALLRRACAGGDPDACGEHASASETFR